MKAGASNCVNSHQASIVIDILMAPAEPLNGLYTNSMKALNVELDASQSAIYKCGTNEMDVLLELDKGFGVVIGMLVLPVVLTENICAVSACSVEPIMVSATGPKVSRIFLSKTGREDAEMSVSKLAYVKGNADVLTPEVVVRIAMFVNLTIVFFVLDARELRDLRMFLVVVVIGAPT
jgi:hypothetical protein